MMLIGNIHLDIALDLLAGRDAIHSANGPPNASSSSCDFRQCSPRKVAARPNRIQRHSVTSSLDSFSDFLALRLVGLGFLLSLSKRTSSCASSEFLPVPLRPLRGWRTLVPSRSSGLANRLTSGGSIGWISMRQVR